MKNSRTILIWVAIGIMAVAAGCRSRSAPEETDDVNAAINKAAGGAEVPPTRRSIILRVLRLSEKDLILGLRTFADLSGGHYPADLETRSTLKQVETDRLGSSVPDLSKERKEQMIQDIFFASAFYDKLQREKRNVQYHGDAVRREDAGKILMCWTESTGRHRVVFGDLRIRTLSGQELADLSP